MKRIRTVLPLPNPRGGTTLTEVLMSLLCMGIGVVAVASLFPIALLRSVQATQLTSGTILRFNAETLIDLHDELPVPDDTKFRNLLFNPDYFRVDPTVPPTSPPNMGDDYDFSEHFHKNYLIDPLGAMIVRDDNGRPPDTTDKVGLLDRFDAMRIFYPTPAHSDTAIPAAERPARAIKQAEDIVTLPDSWVTLYDVISDGNTATSVTLPGSSNIVNTEMDALIDPAITPNPSEMRIILFSNNGRISETRTLSDTSFDTAGSISWAPPLPDNGQYYTAGSVERFRLETKERRFTWLLTVRNDTSTSALDVAAARARVDVVVFFRRSPTLDEETPYQLTGSGRNYIVNKLDQNTWDRIFPPANANSPPYPSPYPDPFLKKGGFLLDTSTGEWHRLQKVNSNTFAITLERNARTLNAHYAVFMKGVVDVFPIGSKP